MSFKGFNIEALRKGEFKIFHFFCFYLIFFYFLLKNFIFTKKDMLLEFMLLKQKF